MGQYYALLWPFMQSHLDVSVTRRGYCPNGVVLLIWQIQQMPPMMAASTYRMNV